MRAPMKMVLLRPAPEIIFPLGDPSDPPVQLAIGIQLQTLLRVTDGPFILEIPIAMVQDYVKNVPKIKPGIRQILITSGPQKVSGKTIVEHQRIVDTRTFAEFMCHCLVAVDPSAYHILSRYPSNFDFQLRQDHAQLLLDPLMVTTRHTIMPVMPGITTD